MRRIVDESRSNPGGDGAANSTARVRAVIARKIGDATSAPTDGSGGGPASAVCEGATLATMQCEHAGLSCSAGCDGCE